MQSSSDPPSSGARADLAASLVLLALGVAVIIGAWNMDRLEVRRIHPASVPGLVPGLLGLALTALAGVLLTQAIRRGGHRASRSAIDTAGAGRVAFLLLLALAYPILLIGQMPYWLATLLFVFAFILLFEWSGSRSPAGRLRAGAMALLQAILTAAIVAYVFQELFRVRLP